MVYTRYLLLFIAFSLFLFAPTLAEAASWYKCAWHVHTLVGPDADDFPDMVAAYYQDAGYNCVFVSEHNKIGTTTLWIGEASIIARAGSDQPIVDYVARFPQYAQKKVSGSSWAWRLWSIPEINTHMGIPGTFWLFGSTEEITGGDSSVFLHVNGFPMTVVSPTAGLDPLTVIDGSAALARANPAVAGTSVFTVVNHPNDTWAITANVLAQLNNVNAVEMYNGLQRSNTYGDPNHQSVEEMWDDANTQRVNNGKTLLFGVGGDDAHRYAGRAANSAAPKKVWLMIYADGLTTADMARALNRGDFYVSTGVDLIDPTIDASTCQYDFTTSQPVDVEVIGTVRILEDPSCPCQGSQGPSGEVIYSVSNVTDFHYVPASNVILSRVRIKSQDPVWYPLKTNETQAAWMQPCAVR